MGNARSTAMKPPKEVILNAGQVLQGRKATYRLLDALLAPTVFKAQVLDSRSIKQECAVVKTALEPLDQKCLRRERNNYLMPGVRSSPYIRSLYDIIEYEVDTQEGLPQKAETTKTPLALVFEWMEYDLWHVPSERFRLDTVLPKVIAKSALSTLAFFKTEYDAIHTDINPNNIFLSDIDNSSPIVKVGDLGNMFDDGYKVMRLQCLECRAPEVWRGLGVWHSSDVWSLGVTLAHWLLGSVIFGPRDKIVEGHTEAWCIAKIQRLIGPIEPPVAPEFEEEFKNAGYLATGSYRIQDDPTDKPFMTVGTLRQELEKISSPKVSEETLDFIEFLLVLDHTKRPTAVEALQHPYLRDIS